jgi:cytochrome c oxidase cbb3-type subunit 3
VPWIELALWLLFTLALLQIDAHNPTDASGSLARAQSCHGANREGHLTEHANSLRTASFLRTVSPLLLDNAIRYGRSGTAMAAYYQALGGPLGDRDVIALREYILSFRPASSTPVEPEKPHAGDASRGARIYATRCQQCHGGDGKGVTAPSLNDRLFLAVATPAFLRAAIIEGRDGTGMLPFRDTLTQTEIDDVTMFVKGWGKAWIEPDPVRVQPTDLKEAVLNPTSPAPVFGQLRDNRYLAVDALKHALDANSRLIVLDVRATSSWGTGHIPGALSLPYYDLKEKMSELPRDGTWIIAYCTCPVHLADLTVDALRAVDFEHTATLDEGLAGWMARGYPIQSGIVPNSAR